MNVGEYLVSKSPLGSGTALAHLLAMQTGSGTGKTIFAAQMTVCMEAPQTTVTQRPSDHSVKTPQHETATAQQDKPNRIAVRTRPARVDVMTRPAAVFVTRQASTIAFVRDAQKAVMTRRKRQTTTTILGASNDRYCL